MSDMNEKATGRFKYCYKRPNHPDIDLINNFVAMAQKGDEILDKLIDKKVNELRSNQLIGYATAHHLKTFLRSNKVLSKFPKPPYKLKTKSLDPHRWKNPSKVGDLREAWIAFLHDNYGFSHAERYVLENFKKCLPKFLKELPT